MTASKEKFYNADGEELAREGGLITKKHLLKAFLCWDCFPQTCYNWERMMGQPFAFAVSQVIDDLYKEEPEKRKEVMQREMEFFNVHVEFGSCIVGMAIAMEEEKAQGADIPGELISNLKTSLMGPLAALGDTVWQVVVIPILLAICIDITNIGGGNIWGAVIYAVVIGVAAFLLCYNNFMFGYRSGGNAILDALEGGWVSKLLKAASIMGCMVMGGLIVNYISVTCGVEFTASGATFNLQTDLFDVLIPYILPLCVVLLSYWLMDSKQWSSNKVMLLLVVIGLVGGLTGILTA